MRNVLVTITGVGSDWNEDLIDIENPSNNTDPNLESEKPSQTSFRQPPSG